MTLRDGTTPATLTSGCRERDGYGQWAVLTSRLLSSPQVSLARLSVDHRLQLAGLCLLSHVARPSHNKPLLAQAAVWPDIPLKS